MKYLHFSFYLCLFFLSSGCATIAGGSRYYAHVRVTDHPNAKIIYKGENKGTGSASFKAMRKEAARFSILLKEEGCPDQVYLFKTRTFRGWAFVGSLITYSLMLDGVPIPLPLGVFIDLATGAYWKPNASELGIDKIDYNNFSYQLDYANCPVKKETTKYSYTNDMQAISIVDVVYLKNGSIIRGIITEVHPNVQIKIKTQDGSIFVFQMDEIEKMTKEEVE